MASPPMPKSPALDYGLGDRGSGTNAANPVVEPSSGSGGGAGAATAKADGHGVSADCGEPWQTEARKMAEALADSFLLATAAREELNVELPRSPSARRHQS